MTCEAASVGVMVGNQSIKAEKHRNFGDLLDPIEKLDVFPVVQPNSISLSSCRFEWEGIQSAPSRESMVSGCDRDYPALPSTRRYSRFAGTLREHNGSIFGVQGSGEGADWE